MKKYFYYFLDITILFLAEIALVKTFTSQFYLLPQLTLLFIIVYALSHTLSETIWISFAVGFIHEIVSAQFFGAYIWTFLLSGIFIYLVTSKWTDRKISLPAAVGLVASTTLLFSWWAYVYNLLIALVGLSGNLPVGNFFFWKLIWTTVANLLLFYPVKFIQRLIPDEKSLQT